MRIRLFWFLGCVALLFGLTTRPGKAEEPKRNSKEEAALLKNAEAFVEAFHKGDAAALAAFWTSDGDYTDQLGKHLKGREAIEKAFKEFFAENKGLKLRINIGGLRFATPDVAIEDGTTEVITPDGSPPSRVRYTIVHVKKDGEWRLSSVRDSVYAPATNYENLRELEWAIGDWADDVDKGEVARISFGWGPNQNFIVSTFETTIKNFTIAGGTQWIGWDPTAKHIRSWTFDTSGGFGGGAWSRDGDKWTIKTTSVTKDGKKMAATSIVTRIDADTISWQSTNRTMDGKELPDIKEIKMKRVK